MKRCPLCGKLMSRAIYAGVPVWLCSDEVCSCIDGVLTFVVEFLAPFQFGGFYFHAYEGSYLRGLFEWWRACGDEGEDES